jgi:hypothetical protein
MSLWSFLDERVKRLGFLDTKLAQTAAIFVSLVIVKLIPEIMELSICWFVALAVLFGIRPVIAFFCGK